MLILNVITNTIEREHTAWQVDFNVGLGSFRPFFKSIRQLVEIALSSSYTQPPKIQFISSNGVFQSE